MAIDWGEMRPRRLPIYLLVCCSASMAGVKMAGVNNGTQMLYQELMNDPRSLDTVHISVITFSDRAYKMPFVPIDQFTPPKLEADDGGSSLGAALELLVESLEHDVQPNRPGKKGDYKALVFILTDGNATDHWQTASQRLAQRVQQRLVYVIAVAVGQDADVNVLHQITDTVVRIEVFTPEWIHVLFSEEEKSVAISSPSLAARGPHHATLPELPPLPSEWVLTEGAIVPASQRPRVFVSHSHADDTFTKRLVDDLRKAGAEVWVDDTAIRDGNFAKRISDGLDKSDYLVLVLTPHAIASDWVQDEVFIAYTNVKQGRMRAVIPMLAAACDPKSIPSVWGSLHRYDATRDYQAALAGLLRALGLPGSSSGISIEL